MRRGVSSAQAVTLCRQGKSRGGGERGARPDLQGFVARRRNGESKPPSETKHYEQSPKGAVLKLPLLPYF